MVKGAWVEMLDEMEMQCQVAECQANDNVPSLSLKKGVGASFGQQASRVAICNNCCTIYAR